MSSVETQRRLRQAQDAFVQAPTVENGRALIRAKTDHSLSSSAQLDQLTLEDAIVHLSEKLNCYMKQYMLEWGVRDAQPYTEEEIQAAIPAATRVTNITVEERYGVPKHYITLVYFENIP